MAAPPAVQPALVTAMNARTCPCGGRVDVVATPTSDGAPGSAPSTTVGACERCGEWFDADELLELPRHPGRGAILRAADALCETRHLSSSVLLLKLAHQRNPRRTVTLSSRVDQSTGHADPRAFNHVGVNRRRFAHHGDG
jgi:hypothetical protein